MKNIAVKIESHPARLNFIRALYGLGFFETPNLLLGESLDSGWEDYSHIIIRQNKTFTGRDFVEHDERAMSIGDALAHLCEHQIISVKLNDDYTAILSHDGIKVGCQTFPLSVIDELVKAKKLLQ